MNPNTLQDWQAYIDGLSGMPLWSKAVAANSQAFVDTLIEEGFGMSDVQEILTMFARQLRATGQKLPTTGAFDLVELSRMPRQTV